MVSFSEPSTASEAGQNYMDVILAIRKDMEIGCRVPVAELAARREQRFLLRAAKETINYRQADFTHGFTFIRQELSKSIARVVDAIRAKLMRCC